MSQSTEWSAEDRAAAAAVRRHHAQLAGELNRRAEALLDSADAGPGRDAEPARHELLRYLRDELVPHARAEEQTLYPAAAARSEGALLVEGMLGEHRAIMALVEEISTAASPARAAAAARALSAVFATHLAKENDLVVPLVAGAGDSSLARLLEGMHALLGGAG